MQSNIPTRLRLTVGAIIPVAVITTIACAIIGMIGFIVVHTVQTHGLMPRPTQLEHYTCDGFDPPIQIAFRHGLEVMQLQTGGLSIQGSLLNGKITWQGLSGTANTARLAVPTEVIYDDARSLRLVASDRSQHVCTLTPLR